MVDQVSHHTSTQRVEPTTTAGGGGSTRAYVQVQGMQASRARTYLVSAFGLAPPLQGLVLSPVRRRELRPARRARAASAHDGHVREEQRACAGHASSRRLLPPCRIACCVHHTQMRIRLATVATTTRSKGWHRAAERWPKTRTKTNRETTTHGRHDDRVRASRATQGQQASLLVAPCLQSGASEHRSGELCPSALVSASLCYREPRGLAQESSAPGSSGSGDETGTYTAPEGLFSPPMSALTITTPAAVEVRR